ncbi:hypothetical protein FH972_025088 [Carpinus fangiana]|uniref:mitogen-activated protein kinase kinase n=1 Tax=Carpinus fangiana TaxID=176857 RepID=A0A5N6L0B7_9ROSI|nr:hypothetical protein FH972_025088 [Carpinus fangiana]
MTQSLSHDESEDELPESPASDSLSPVLTPSSSADPLASARQGIPSPVQPSSPTTAGMTASSTPLGSINAARRPNLPQSTLSRTGTGLTQDLSARMKAFQLGRQGAAPSPAFRGQGGPAGSASDPASPRLGPGGIPTNFRMPPGVGARPAPHNFNSSPAVPNASAHKPSLAEKRGMQLPGGLAGPPTLPSSPAPPAARKRPGLKLSDIGASTPTEAGQPSQQPPRKPEGTLLEKYADFIDPKTGSLMFKGKATLTNQGVVFSSGKTFNISLDEVDTQDELGKGNYGTVYKVRHARPQVRVPGQGLAGNKARSSLQQPCSASPASSTFSEKDKSTTGLIMAMKEIRLELDDAKFAAIIMELDILHRCISPFIVDFYGAFFQEGAVYICMEFMDGGSIDKVYGDGIPEGVLRKIALATTMGLKSLKDEHNIIHRDVKPTNILINTRGQVKICDFGVSGNLVASIAKTNIGCQSYMAPERISSGGVAQAGANPGGGTYSVQSDIWSLGLTVIECAMGRYPYPPETYDNIFSQLSAIVDGDPPDLPASYSEAAHDFVHGCLMKIPKLRPTYAMLLQHAWFAPLLKPPTISEEDEEAAEAGAELPANAGPDLEAEATTEDKEVAEWVLAALERKRNGTMGKSAKPALHAAPLDVTSPTLEKSGVLPTPQAA